MLSGVVSITANALELNVDGIMQESMEEWRRTASYLSQLLSADATVIEVLRGTVP